MITERWDVAISGGGIGGVVLALGLARAGLRVLVLEQARRFAPIYRGEFLQPRSLEILQELGLGPEIEAVTTEVHSVRMALQDGRLLGMVNYQDLPGPIREGRNGHHRQIQAVVLRALERESTVELRMGVRVTGLLRNAKGAVSGLQTTEGPVEAWLTVGAEGQHSTVRNQLGLAFTERRYPGEPLAVTVDLDHQTPKGVEFIFGTGEGALMFPLPERQARLYLAVRDAQFTLMREAPDRGLAYLKERLSALLPRLRHGIDRIPSMDVVQRIPCWYLRAKEWVADGAAILGDAAHCISPTRGQGMNLAIADAAALTELVASLPRNHVPRREQLLPYQRRRQRPADFIQRDAGRVHEMMLAVNPLVILGRNVWLGAIKRAPKTMAVVLKMYAGTARPPVWYDHLFVTGAIAFPPADQLIAERWGSRLPRQ